MRSDPQTTCISLETSRSLKRHGHHSVIHHVKRRMIQKLRSVDFPNSVCEKMNHMRSITYIFDAQPISISKQNQPLHALHHGMVIRSVWADFKLVLGNVLRSSANFVDQRDLE